MRAVTFTLGVVGALVLVGFGALCVEHHYDRTSGRATRIERLYGVGPSPNDPLTIATMKAAREETAFRAKKARMMADEETQRDVARVDAATSRQ